MTTYKSKDVEYMQKLQKAILRGMRGLMPEEKTYTWEYVRKQVVLDDLQSYAIGLLGKIVQFPTENFNGKVMAVFLHKPTAPELDILESMMKKCQVKKEDLYITWFGKAEVDNEADAAVLQSLLETEIKVVNPELIVSFGLNIHPQQHTVVDFKEAKCLVTYDLDYLFKDNPIPLNERKLALWNDVKHIMQYYKM